LKPLTSVLSNVGAYVGLQKALGADRLRYRCIDAAEIVPGETVLDIGCGPAYYLDRLPGPVTYHGFDTDRGYIEWARNRWGDRGTFHLGMFDSEAAESLPTFDVVLMLGLLHHVSDEHARDLMALCARRLNPGGRVISVDTCYEPTQGRISRWMSDHDRGEHVREPGAFSDLAREAFDGVDGETLTTTSRVPSSFWMMRSSSPKVTAELRS
jgi:SAM-dependent methyltransferase